MQDTKTYLTFTLDGNNIVVRLIRIDDLNEYKAFSSKFYDIQQDRRRYNDTEAKMWYHFINTHMQNTGSHFESNYISVLHTCASCKSKMHIFEETVINKGKTININAKHSDFEKIFEIENHLNP